VGIFARFFIPDVPAQTRELGGHFLPDGLDLHIGAQVWRHDVDWTAADILQIRREFVAPVAEIGDRLDVAAQGC
jgi:hypothetical protein